MIMRAFNHDRTCVYDIEEAAFVPVHMRTCTRDVRAHVYVRMFALLRM